MCASIHATLLAESRRNELSSDQLSNVGANAQCSHLAALAEQSGLQPFVLRGRTLLPIVQGGMGVGVSAHRLAGTVASLGAMGTIASVDLRHHHPDLMARTASLPIAPETKGHL